ncbi:hypothetical protein GV827_22505 [Sulfitobacter sp. JBTF-M27]|uniref:Uncharacterized protein n=1 Tax=Sulfitobacter sediminilitoris TaxID=2698830 RepID=A0A6P0CG31_9RHOB|nr:hypothetical protein [Sulfitobacter sediminilitoris]NEK25141.1 hypothetical protein [Sulfitobacter sediminilitoris]
MSYSRAILGDNQFLGVNHSDQLKAAKSFERFRNPDSVLEIIAVAYGAGVRDFMFTTHDRYDLVFEEIRRSNLFPGMQYTPCIPYAHKYWSRLSTQSMPRMLTSTAMQINPFRAISGGIALLAGRPAGLVRVLVEIEALMCKGLPVRGVFLQNAAFDMLMAVEAYRELEAFADIVTRRFAALPGFITMNHPRAVSVLCDKIGLELPWICANFNVAGFRTNPSKAEVEASFATRRSHNIAMSVFASGNSNGQSSLNYVISKVGDVGGVDAILFGSSSARHIKSNTRAILSGAE